MVPNDAVVHLTMRRGLETLAIGTGVLYRRNDRVYLVTAWHNLTGRHSETLKFLRRDGAYPSHVDAEIARRTPADGGTFHTRWPVRLILEDDCQTYYLVHPQGWPRIDVAVIPLDLDRSYESEIHASDGSKRSYYLPLCDPSPTDGASTTVVCIQDFSGGSEVYNIDFRSNTQVSDDLFVVGYPKGIADQLLQPIWKRATVASNPQERWNGQRKFLIDCASREGMSGAPAITYSKSGNFQVGGMTYMSDGPATLFQGIYVGRVGKVDEFEAQIGTVWRHEVIDEIIDGNVTAPMSIDVEAMPSEIELLIKENWPESSEYADAVVNGGRLTGWLTYEIMAKLNGRAVFEIVDAAVRREAELRCSSD